MIAEFLKKLQKSDVMELLHLKKKMAEAKLKLFVLMDFRVSFMVIFVLIVPFMFPSFL